MTFTDKAKVKKAMGSKSGDLFYLGEQNNSKNISAFVKVYLLRIKRLTEKASVIHKETYTEFLQDEKKNVETIITSYDTKAGKIGSFEYTERNFKDVIQYFGDVDALMALKPYDIVAHEV